MDSSIVATALVTIGKDFNDFVHLHLLFPAMATSSIILLIGAGLLTTISATPLPQPPIYAYQVIFGLGLGGLLRNSVIVKPNAREADMASAQGLLNQGRILGGNIGLAVATIMLNNHLSEDLKGALTQAQIESLRRDVNVVETLSGDEAKAVGMAVASAFRGQMLACVGVAGGLFRR